MAMLGVDTSSITGTQPLEMLLISSGSADPNSTIIIDPRTGVSAWSYKGSELQGASTGFVEPLGRNGEHIIVTTKERPLVHVLAVHNKDRFHQKTVLSGPVSAICSNKDGQIVYMAIRKQIYSWLLTTGELLSVIDAHYQNITKMVLSDDDSMLFSCSKDGAIHGYLITDLLSADRDNTVTPFRKWSSHTLSVSDLKITNGLNPRILSCGLDHIACIHSISLDSVILKISSDRQLTSCAIDPAETRVFVGTDVGNIAQINLFQLGSERELLVQTGDENNNKFRILNGHSDEIMRMTINTDGTLLASGDASGKYCIWEISSHQCLKVSNMRSSIMTLRFIPYWPSVASFEQFLKSRPVWDLRREPTKVENLAIEVAEEINVDKEYWKSVIDDTINDMLIESGSGHVYEKATSIECNEVVSNDVIVLDDDEEQGAPEIGNTKSSKKKAKKNKKKLQNKQVTSIVQPIVKSDNVDGNAESKVDELLKSIEELKNENGRLKEINRQMYEFVAKEIATDSAQ